MIAATVTAQLAAAQMAFAQTDAASPTAAATQQTSPPQLTEIIVTAERTSQNLQTTPISITALSAKDIEQHGFTNVLDVAQVAPSLTIQHPGAARPARHPLRHEQ